MSHMTQPCTECPWRTDVPTGKFPPERYRALANTAYDLSTVQFACHKSRDEHPLACAGFLLRGADHNLGARLNYSRGEYGEVSDGGHPLHECFRDMAVANGVDPEDPVLTACR